MRWVREYRCQYPTGKAPFEKIRIRTSQDLFLKNYYLFIVLEGEKQFYLEWHSAPFFLSLWPYVFL